MRKKVIVTATVAMPARFRGGVAFRQRVVVLALAFALGAALALSSAGPAFAEVAEQTEHVMNQDGVGYYAEDAAHLTRQTNGILIRCIRTCAAAKYLYVSPRRSSDAVVVAGGVHGLGVRVQQPGRVRRWSRELLWTRSVQPRCGSGCL